MAWGTADAKCRLKACHEQSPTRHRHHHRQREDATPVGSGNEMVTATSSTSTLNHGQYLPVPLHARYASNADNMLFARQHAQPRGNASRAFERVARWRAKRVCEMPEHRRSATAPPAHHHKQRHPWRAPWRATLLCVNKKKYTKARVSVQRAVNVCKPVCRMRQRIMPSFRSD